MIQRLDAFQGSDGRNNDSKTDAEAEGETDSTTPVQMDSVERSCRNLSPTILDHVYSP